MSHASYSSLLQISNLFSVTLNRPKALNALSTPLITELNSALLSMSSSPDIRVLLLTGSERAFAAGADIKEMAPLSFSEAYTTSLYVISNTR